MTRAVLCGSLAALTLVLGILTAIIQSENHDRGQRLNLLKEECSMIEAINGDRSEQILERDFGPISLDSWPANAAQDRNGAAPAPSKAAPVNPAHAHKALAQASQGAVR